MCTYWLLVTTFHFSVFSFNFNFFTFRLHFRSGTAVGALISEAEFAQSRADFINKLHVALKEVGETDYWLNVMIAGGDLEEDIYKPLNILLKEVISMLVVSLKTAKKNGL
jgi:four helix bundle protein